MIQVVCLSWEDFKKAFSPVYRDVERSLLDSAENTLSVRRPDWCLRIDHDKRCILFDYMGSAVLRDLPASTGPRIFKVEGCPYLI